MTMKHILSCLCLLGSFLHALTRCTVPASEFHLKGDYLIGGLINIHQISSPLYHNRPEAIDCTSQPLILSNYRRFQLMRFAVEQINNSTSLLPNVSLGYDIFDHCSDTQSFPGILKLISVNDLIKPWDENHKNLSKVIGVIGAYTSTESLTVAPLFMMHLIPMISYGASTSVLSRKRDFPSFLRTVHPNQDTLEVIVHIVRHFDWRWVAFLYSDDDYGKDVLELFKEMIQDTGICLAYSSALSYDTHYPSVFRQIEAQKINVIIVIAIEWLAEAVIESAMALNVTNRVWIAGDAWSLNKRLPKEKGIKNIGTVLGISEQAVAIPGFSDFIYSFKAQNCKNTEQKFFCSQNCNCSNVSAEEILAAEQSFSFTVYSAVYSIAHALHSVLQCRADRCNDNITVNPAMVIYLRSLKIHVPVCIKCVNQTFTVCRLEKLSITFCLLLLILTWIIFATVYILYRGKYIQILNALAVLSSLYSFLLWYFFPKCYIIIFQPHKNTPQYFQGLIQNYTKTISQ
uniref:G-protein coupled receptors family 3 profile domain-containing protein n=1 Tax=Stegastes partitus TaxID=144197 RepID=A0A3B5AYA7_9TELE